MNKFRENLIDYVSSIYGLEHEITIKFATRCENLPDTFENDIALAKTARTYGYLATQ